MCNPDGECYVMVLYTESSILSSRWVLLGLSLHQNKPMYEGPFFLIGCKWSIHHSRAVAGCLLDNPTLHSRKQQHLKSLNY